MPSRAAIIWEYQAPQTMTRYLTVRCPSAPWENTEVAADRAYDLCLDLSEEFGYACVMEGELIIGEYTNGR